MSVRLCVRETVFWCQSVVEAGSSTQPEVFLPCLAVGDTLSFHVAKPSLLMPAYGLPEVKVLLGVQQITGYRPASISAFFGLRISL